MRIQLPRELSQDSISTKIIISGHYGSWDPTDVRKMLSGP